AGLARGALDAGALVGRRRLDAGEVAGGAGGAHAVAGADGLAAAGGRVAELVGGALDVGAGDQEAAGDAGAAHTGLAGGAGLAGAGIAHRDAGGAALLAGLAGGRRGAGIGLAGAAHAGLAHGTAAAARAGDAAAGAAASAAAAGRSVAGQGAVAGAGGGVVTAQREAGARGAASEGEGQHQRGEGGLPLHVCLRLAFRRFERRSPPCRAPRRIRALRSPFSSGGPVKKFHRRRSVALRRLIASTHSSPESSSATTCLVEFLSSKAKWMFDRLTVRSYHRPSSSQSVAAKLSSAVAVRRSSSRRLRPSS